MSCRVYMLENVDRGVSHSGAPNDAGAWSRNSRKLRNLKKRRKKWPVFENSNVQLVQHQTLASTHRVMSTSSGCSELLGSRQMIKGTMGMACTWTLSISWFKLSCASASLRSLRLWAFWCRKSCSKVTRNLHMILILGGFRPKRFRSGNKTFHPRISCFKFLALQFLAIHLWKKHEKEYNIRLLCSTNYEEKTGVQLTEMCRVSSHEKMGWFTCWVIAFCLDVFGSPDLWTNWSQQA